MIGHRRPKRPWEIEEQSFFPPLALTTILRTSLPQVFDGKKLSAVGRGITSLDLVPKNVAQSVTALFLSDNNLSRLDHIGQFRNLRSLSLANNLLRSIDDLQPLQVS